MPSEFSLRTDAVSIWKAGVDAVDSERLVGAVLSVDDGSLNLCGDRLALNEIHRVAVVGAGKAGAGMARAVESALGNETTDGRVTGWVNVPADCAETLRRIRLHPARPAGHNEPTLQGVEGASEILRIVSGLDEADVCIVLLSGGGSALLPAPARGISLEDKQAVTRQLMHGGATINQLNTVRKQLSRIKGGGLVRACTAGRVYALIVSDVIGDPLDVIASGPTVDDPSTPHDAIDVLQTLVADRDAVPQSVWRYLENAAADPTPPEPIGERVQNHVIGNNATAVAAACAEAARRGYSVVNCGSGNAGIARDVGRDLTGKAARIRSHGDPVAPPACVISGGEPVVQLVPTDEPRRGGRNQELVLAALADAPGGTLDRIVLLSGGTDGEDGPTDAAGGVVDQSVLQRARALGLNAGEFLAINNSYPFLDQTGGLLKTGPTHTNVMDLRVVLVGDA